jgi:hypothetical protein
MKTRIVLCLLLALAIGGCMQEKRGPNEGAWQLISAQHFVNDSLVSNFPGTYSGSDVKMWSENYFVFVGLFKRDTTVINSYGGGAYTLEGKKYIESIQYHTNPGAVGQVVNMTLEVRNDTLIQTWPVDEQGKGLKSEHNIEKYVRMK